MYDPSHPTWRAFVAGIREDPASDDQRLIFADFIDELTGLNPSPLADFIRAGIELDRNPDGFWLDGCGDLRIKGNSGPILLKPWNPLYGLQQRLRRGLRLTWLAWPFFATEGLDDTYRRRWVFRRGFPEIAVAHLDWWWRHGDTVCSLAAVDELVLTHRPDVDTIWMDSLIRVVLREEWLRGRVAAPERIIERDNWDDMDVVTRNRLVDSMEERWVEEAYPGIQSCSISVRR